jgi:hypothetical protein
MTNIIKSRELIYKIVLRQSISIEVIDVFLVCLQHFQNQWRIDFNGVSLTTIRG